MPRSDNERFTTHLSRPITNVVIVSGSRAAASGCGRDPACKLLSRRAYFFRIATQCVFLHAKRDSRRVHSGSTALCTPSALIKMDRVREKLAKHKATLEDLNEQLAEVDAEIEVFPRAPAYDSFPHQEQL